jgi:hypothetical protein
VLGDGAAVEVFFVEQVPAPARARAVIHEEKRSGFHSLDASAKKERIRGGMDYYP